MSYEIKKKCSSLAPPKGIFYMTQWAWQGLKLIGPTIHTDLDGPRVYKKSSLRQNELQLNRKCLESIVSYSPSPLLSTF